jgi:hypothetical protein
VNIERLQDACKLRGLDFDGTPPDQVSPGVFLFYATPLTHECHVSGDCRHLRYYAIMLGDDIVIQHVY